MLARLRISLPDRPGSMGRITTTLGTAGADIAAVDVLQSESGRALDDVYVTVRDSAHLDRVSAEVDSLVGASVIAVQRSVPPKTGHADLELAAQVLHRSASTPEAALRVLVDGAPGALGADWAVLLSYAEPTSPSIVIASATAPEPRTISLNSPLRLRAVKVSAHSPAQVMAGAALVPIEDYGQGRGLALLLTREQGPDFHRSELWRLGQLGRVLGKSATVPV